MANFGFARFGEDDENEEEENEFQVIKQFLEIFSPYLKYTKYSFSVCLIIVYYHQQIPRPYITNISVAITF